MFKFYDIPMYCCNYVLVYGNLQVHDNIFLSMIFSMKVVFRNKWQFLVEISEFFFLTFEANHIVMRN
jgi:hypothetical protein